MLYHSPLTQISEWNTGSRIASGMHTTMKRPAHRVKLAPAKL